jgi:retinol dehydrogenase-12
MVGTSERLTGKTALVTGANTGIGQVTARELARAGAMVYIACRSREAGEAAVMRIREESGGNVALLALDLADLASVRGCAASFLARNQPLHILVNNAGVAGARGQTHSGFELAFGINHVGHFLLTQLLLPRMRESGPARIVTVASRAHYNAKSIPWDALRSSTQSLVGLPEYAVSKLANVLHSAELARRLKGTEVRCYALHPGVIASDVWRTVPQPFRSVIRLFMKGVEEGADNSIYCASSPDVLDQSGLYFDGRKPKEPSALAKDLRLALELWERSEAWVAG